MLAFLCELPFSSIKLDNSSVSTFNATLINDNIGEIVPENFEYILKKWKFDSPCFNNTDHLIGCSKIDFSTSDSFTWLRKKSSNNNGSEK